MAFTRAELAGELGIGPGGGRSRAVKIRCSPGRLFHRSAHLDAQRQGWLKAKVSFLIESEVRGVTSQ